MPRKKELWGGLKLNSRPCSSTWTRGSTRYSTVCYSDKSSPLHAALMARTTASLAPGGSPSVMVTNLVIRLFDSQTRAAAEDTLIKVRENSYTKRIKAIPPTVSLLIMDSWLQSQVESVLDFISLEEFTCSLETTAKETKFVFFFPFSKS